MHYSEEKLREAARTIRPTLKTRLSEADAQTLGAQLDEFLEQAQQGTQVGPSIQKLLSQHDETRTLLQVFLETGQYPAALRGFSPLPGTSRPTLGDKFVCPDGDYEWYRPFVGALMPLCPKHKKQLVKSLKTA